MLKYYKAIAQLIFILSAVTVNGQYNWMWTELDTMPVRTSNNAVCEAIVNGTEYVYSFGGIDTTKEYSGIHQRSFKYDVLSNQWSEIDPLPDTLGKISAAASFVKNKIYIIGGYHVFQGGSEISSNRVHIYNPQTEQFEANGAPVPIPIDDHVQCVYKDSLIYVVTGWSNTTNKPDVQIYDPTIDQWLSGTSTPNTGYFKVFGASGYIIGDTIYYHGGTTAGFSFTAQPFMRKGYINPNDPTLITWELMNDAPGASGYRSACSGSGNTVFWVGGAGTAYNFDGIAYDGSGGVDPSARILHFNNWSYQHIDNVSEPHGVMDLRGIATLPGNRWVICGGMDSSQVVSNRTFLLENFLLNDNTIGNDKLSIESGMNTIVIRSKNFEKASIINMMGQTIKKYKEANEFMIDKSQVEPGIYLFQQGETSVRIRL